MATPTAMLDLITSQGSSGVRVKWFYRDDNPPYSVVTPTMLTNGSYLLDGSDLYHDPSNTASSSVSPAYAFTPTQDVDGGFYVDVNFDIAAPTGRWTVKTTFTHEGVTRTQYLGFVVTAGGATVSPASTYYCTLADVSQVLQKPVPQAEASEGEASLDYWYATVLGAMDEIDRTTKQAWREARVENEVPYDGLGNMPDAEGFIMVPLRKQKVRDFNLASGDSLQVWNGSQYDNWLSTRSQGRNADYYVENDLGQVYIRTSNSYGNAKNRVKVTYRYGNSTVPYNIRRATALLAAAELGVGQVSGQHGHGQDLDDIRQDTRVDAWRNQAMRLITPYVSMEGL